MIELQLPSDILWAAAQIAARAEKRVGCERLIAIHLRGLPETQKVQVEATDGHIAFRVQLPAAFALPADSSVVPEFQAKLPFEPFKKVLKGWPRIAVVIDDNKVSKITWSSSTGQNVINDPVVFPGDWPDTDQVAFPDRQYSNRPNQPWAFDPELMETIIKIVNKIGMKHGDHRTIALATNGATSPIELRAAWHAELKVTLRFILMPILMRKDNDMLFAPGESIDWQEADERLARKEQERLEEKMMLWKRIESLEITLKSLNRPQPA